jgi:hypothetical protein
MARNYTEQVIRVIGKSETANATLDVLGTDDTMLAKWNALAGVLSDPQVCDLVMLAFAAGRSFENAQIANKASLLFN